MRAGASTTNTGVPHPTPTGPAQPSIDPERLKRVADACRAWIRKLIDPSRNNNLLFFRPLKEGTLNLSAAPDEAIAALLSFAAGPVPLEQFVTAVELHGASGKLQEIRRRAQANEEERGIETLHLALGMASWPAADGGRPYAAPLFLMPVEVQQQGTERRRLLLRRKGDVQPNLVLLHHLDLQGITVDAEQVIELIEGDDEGESFNLEPAFSWFRQRCTSIPDFAIDRQFILGNFSFQKMAMVQDLRSYVNGMAAHDLIAAVAQDGAARDKVRGDRVETDASEPDRRSPDQEFLVLDADSTQQRAIGSALSGQSGVISGPPGTGKSQTIANLIAEFAARGKRVLFVAEKRAALEAVYKRLDNKGLGHLCLDLHGATVSRAKVMERIAYALERTRDAGRVNAADVHSRLVERRERLNRHVRRMHTKCGHSGLTVFEIQGRLLRLPSGSSSAVRWRNSALETLDASHAREIQELLQEAAAFEGLFLRAGPSPWTGAQIPTTKDARRLHDLAIATRQRWLATVDRAIGLVTAAGLSQPLTLPGLAERAELLYDADRLLSSFDENLFTRDLDSLNEALKPSLGPIAHLWAMLFNAGYRAARVECTRLRRTPAESRRALKDEIDAASTIWSRWLPMRNGESTPRQSPEAAIVRSELEALALAMTELQSALPPKIEAAAPLQSLKLLLDSLAEDGVSPFQQVRVLEIESRLSLLGLGVFIEELRSLKTPVASWISRFQHAWLRSWLDAAHVEDAELSTFSGLTHQAAVDEFKALDQQRLKLAVERVRRAHAENVIEMRNRFSEQDALVRKEAGKKRRHIPLRKLFQEAPDVMMALHPCWMASPLSVSQLLPGDRQYFDAVVFDEASQVLPEDAVTSLYRGKEAVVAGDRRQLPPTTFFAAGSDEEGDEESATGGFESLLDVMSSFLEPAWGLDWHYRSRDESLIAFSNHHVYGDRLVTFPGAGGEPVLSHVLVPHVGGAFNEESSSPEVEAVVRLVVEHAATRPHETLGVIAMGLSHARRVEAAVDRAVQDRPELGAFFDTQKSERFFVKNLERVQGDEREAIILTVGYGKDASGKLPYRFGPLLSEGGERRLNVAVTRARGRMTAVSSFSHFDMDPARSNAKGVQLLRAYLEYAACGGSRQTGGEQTTVPLNDFEQAVHDAAARRGIKLLGQWGASTYRIDLVAQHPERHGRFVLAVECDGATYHSSATARDRDRLRQQHLEALGWRFHRVWSTDWFLNPEAELVRFETAFRDAVTAADQADALDGVGAQNARTGEAEDLAPRGSPLSVRPPCPSVPNRSAINDYSSAEIDGVVRWILTGPLKTDDEVVTEAMGALGFARRGSKIDAAIRSSISRVKRHS